MTLSVLREYYGHQLRIRKCPRTDDTNFSDAELRTQILLRKTYSFGVKIKKGYTRRSFPNISAYAGIHLYLRDTQIFIGVPYHVLSIRIKIKR